MRLGLQICFQAMLKTGSVIEADIRGRNELRSVEGERSNSGML
jgi:hypothetical protein